MNFLVTGTLSPSIYMHINVLMVRITLLKGLFKISFIYRGQYSLQCLSSQTTFRPFRIWTRESPYNLPYGTHHNLVKA
jgi:hypothetical protein